MRGYSRSPIMVLATIICLLAGTSLEAAVLRVPADFPTIKAAVSRAADGDTVLVDDGVYLEKNIEISKNIVVRSRNTFGAVIYGSAKNRSTIFTVRAGARIEGFTLVGSMVGIEQRDSPDVLWAASDLLIVECHNAISVNDEAENVGSAELRRIIVLGSGKMSGISTNDARAVEASGCMVMGCDIAFQGGNHLSFRIKDALILDCERAFSEGASHRPIPPATSRIEMGTGLHVLRSAQIKEPGQLDKFKAALRASVLALPAGTSGSDVQPGAKECVFALIMAEALSRAGSLDAASRTYEAARSAAERNGYGEIVWRALCGSARAEQFRGASRKALRLYGDAVDHLERWIPLIAAGIYSVDFLYDKMPIYESAIGLLFECHRLDPRAGYDRQAFNYSERAKSLARRFPSPRALKNQEAPSAGDGDRAGAAGRIAAAQIRLQDPAIDGPDKERLISVLERAEDDFHATLVRDGRSWTGANPAVLDHAGVRQKLRGRALLSYFLGRARSFAFLAIGESLRCAELPATAEIEEKVGSYLRFLKIREGRKFIGIRAGQILYDTLVAPVIGSLGDLRGRLIVVPDGVLHYLPFEALVSGRDDHATAGAGFLIGADDISYASSASQALANDPLRWEEGKPLSLLAVGDSGAIRWDNRSRRLKQYFPPLAHVRKEIQALIGSSPWQRSTTLLDDAAGEGAVKAVLASGYDIIHLAGHGVIDDVSWWRSALLLRPEAASGEDGFLTALEISMLDIPASLVVLSGCGTGAGPLFQGEGIKGLSGAFLKAGADNVLVSLWNVDDRQTAVFMDKFYGQLAKGELPARALGQAKAEMIREGLSNPFYWAPFVLIGRAEDSPQR